MIESSESKAELVLGSWQSGWIEGLDGLMSQPEITQDVWVELRGEEVLLDRILMAADQDRLGWFWVLLVILDGIEWW